MDDILQSTINRFRAYLERRQFSAHTVVSYTTDLRLFFAEVTAPLAHVSFREVDQFVETQHQHSRSWATINRRLGIHQSARTKNRPIGERALTLYNRLDAALNGSPEGIVRGPG